MVNIVGDYLRFGSHTQKFANLKEKKETRTRYEMSRGVCKVEKEGSGREVMTRIQSLLWTVDDEKYIEKYELFNKQHSPTQLFLNRDGVHEHGM